MATDLIAPGTAGNIVVIFALEREAAPFRRLSRGDPRIAIHVSGIGRERAQRRAEHIVETSPPARIIAAGFCGALIPTLKVGDIVASPRILTVDHLVCDPAEKRLLASQHSADAVDMESAAIAEVCAAKGIPFLALRAVSDLVDTALSPELIRLFAGGNVSLLKALEALGQKPSLLWEFLRLGRDSNRAARELANALMNHLAEKTPEDLAARGS